MWYIVIYVILCVNAVNKAKTALRLYAAGLKTVNQGPICIQGAREAGAKACRFSSLTRLPCVDARGTRRRDDSPLPTRKHMAMRTTRSSPSLNRIYPRR